MVHSCHAEGKRQARILVLNRPRRCCAFVCRYVLSVRRWARFRKCQRMLSDPSYPKISYAKNLKYLNAIPGDFKPV
jgi:hypothetical protein